MDSSEVEEVALLSVYLFDNKSRRKQAKNVVSGFVKYSNVVKSMESSQIQLLSYN